MKNSTKSKINFILVVVIFTAWFVNAWALICAVAAYAMWKFCKHSDKQKHVRIKADTGKTTTNIKENTPVEPIKATDSGIRTEAVSSKPEEVLDDPFDPENQEYLPQEPTDPVQKPE